MLNLESGLTANLKDEPEVCNGATRPNGLRVRPLIFFTLYYPSSFRSRVAECCRRISQIDPPRKSSATVLNAKLRKLKPPPLNQSLNLYLEYAKPLVVADAWSRTKQFVESFLSSSGDGRALQQLLEVRAEKKTNWLSDYWLSSYLMSRSPVVVHSNPGVWMPEQNFASQAAWLSYASAMIAGALDYKATMDAGELPDDKVGRDLACMSQYYCLFGNCRIPGLKEDALIYRYGSPFNGIESRDVCIFYRNRPYSIQAIDAVTKQALHPGLIYRQLEAIVHNESREGAPPPAPPMGLLTAMQRDDLYRAYEDLRKDQLNRSTLEIMQRSLFVLCLDDTIQLPRPTHSAHPALERSPRYLGVAMNNLHGGIHNTGNRWFDKTLQFIVSRDGGVGLNFEHTPFDAHVVVGVLESALRGTAKWDMDAVLSHSGPKTRPTLLGWNLTPAIETHLKKAEKDCTKLFNSVHMDCGFFTGFSKEWIKTIKMSPDAFIQMAIQLTYSRLHPDRLPPATYESGSLRLFHLGRTEAIRSCSSEAVAFTKAMADDALSKAEKIEALKTAVKQHRAYTDLALTGKAFDRHLLGLKLTALRRNGSTLPDLFTDETFKVANTYRLSTSQISSEFNFGVVFGPVAADGYGVCYNVQRDQIILMVSAFEPTKSGNDPGRFLEGFSTSLLDMQKLFA